MADIPDIIAATLSPIFLVSGGAIFLNFTQARLFRVVDRLRALGTLLRSEEPGPVRDEHLWQRSRHLRRAILLRNAILLTVVTLAFTVLTTLLLLVPNVLLGIDPGAAAIYSFALALVAFSAALGLVVADAFMSVATAKRAASEVDHG